MFNAEAVDLMVHDGLWELYYDYHMGVTAENISEKYQISREDQDQLYPRKFINAPVRQSLPGP